MEFWPLLVLNNKHKTFFSNTLFFYFQIDALKEVVEAVGGKVEVYIDGGVRQGCDVLKVLALGARAVFIGRPVLWGLAYNGDEGVENVFMILKKELKRAMMLAGIMNSTLTLLFVMFFSPRMPNIVFH